MVVREWLEALTEVAVPLIDVIALLAILIGTLEAVVAIVGVVLTRPKDTLAARSVWMRYSRWLIAGLTFQLAADILETSVAPTWDDIGRIAVIAVIRTMLNYFLERDQENMEAAIEKSRREAEAKGEAPAIRT
jgi:uncharacterized membrane protein